MRDFDGKFVEADGETGLMRARSSGREHERRDWGRGKGLRIHDEGEWGGWGEAESGWWGVFISSSGHTPSPLGRE